jgi:hypothetical protein
MVKMLQLFTVEKMYDGLCAQIYQLLNFESLHQEQLALLHSIPLAPFIS